MLKFKQHIYDIIKFEEHIFILMMPFLVENVFKAKVRSFNYKSCGLQVSEGDRRLG